MSRELPTSSATVQPLIECAASLKDAVARLVDGFGKLPAVIAREHEAIKASRFADVQACADEKENLGAAIEAAFQLMTAVSDRLYAYRVSRSRPDAPAVKPVTLKDCVTALEEAAAQLTAGATVETMALQVLSHLVDGLKAASKSFEALYSEVKPRIEVNKQVVAGMLRNIQESYYFWQDITERTASNYDEKGQQEAKGRNSGFRVRA